MVCNCHSYVVGYSDREIIARIDDGCLWIRLPHLPPLQSKQRRRGRWDGGARFSAPAELKKGTSDQGEETMKDGSPAGR